MKNETSGAPESPKTHDAALRTMSTGVKGELPKSVYETKKCDPGTPKGANLSK